MPDSLPQTAGDRLFLTDGGLETTLVFHRGIDLPLFAAFPLLDSGEGRAALRDYFAPYVELAAERGAGFVLDTPTWRASADWAPQLGYDLPGLARVNRDAIAFAQELRDAAGGSPAPIVVNGVIGPRGDGYVAGDQMTAEAAAARLPCAISFTVETDGRLPSGQELGAAIAAVDAATDGGPAYYMVNCAHPSHFAHVLEGLGDTAARIGGLRVNASSKSHAELDEATELDE